MSQVGLGCVHYYSRKKKGHKRGMNHKFSMDPILKSYRHIKLMSPVQIEGINCAILRPEEANIEESVKEWGDGV